MHLEQLAGEPFAEADIASPGTIAAECAAGRSGN